MGLITAMGIELDGEKAVPLRAGTDRRERGMVCGGKAYLAGYDGSAPFINEIDVKTGRVLREFPYELWSTMGQRLLVSVEYGNKSLQLFYLDPRDRQDGTCSL